MKQLFFRKCILLLLGAAVVAGCTKKDSTSSSGNYYVKFDLNGVSVAYDADDYGSQTFSAANGLYTGLILGYKDANSGLRNALDITIFSQQKLESNQNFHDPLKAVASNGDALAQVTVYYYDASANGFVSAGLLTVNGTVPLPGVVADAQVTITELTSAYIKGNFAATVYKSGDVTFQSLYRISNGSFYVKRLQ